MQSCLRSTIAISISWSCCTSRHATAAAAAATSYPRPRARLTPARPAAQEDYIKSEQRSLKSEYLRAQEEVKRIQAVPLVIGQFLEAVDEHTGIVGSTTGSNYHVRILSTVDRELLKPSTGVALHKHSNALVEVLPPEADSSIQILTADERPDVTYADIGGMDIQKQEMREAVELPLTHHELYKQIGIDPPRGVLMYGPPGTGKTMLAKAVAHHTTAAFIRVVGSEFVQKYLGEGPRMVRDVFRMAKENAPAIIFIDEIDAIATKRFDAQTGADREVQRILLELLNQMDGFDQTDNVKVIMATNRADTLDPALLRPGRLDRKIEFPLPDRRQKRLIFSTITEKMNLSDEVDLEDCTSRAASRRARLDHRCSVLTGDRTLGTASAAMQTLLARTGSVAPILRSSARKQECRPFGRTATWCLPRTLRRPTRPWCTRALQSTNFTSKEGARPCHRGSAGVNFVCAGAGAARRACRCSHSIPVRCSFVQFPRSSAAAVG